MKKTLWPVVLIIVGVLLLLNAILPFRLPIVQILIALFCVWIGITMFTSGGKTRDDEEYDESAYDGESYPDDDAPPSGARATGIHTTEEKKGKREYNNVFSTSVIDLTGESDLPKKIEINSVFSSTRVRLPVDYNVSIQASGAFCSITMPNKQNIMLGENTFHYGSQDPNAPKLKVRINCAFASLKCSVG